MLSIGGEGVTQTRARGWCSKGGHIEQLLQLTQAHSGVQMNLPLLSTAISLTESGIVHINRLGKNSFVKYVEAASCVGPSTVVPQLVHS